MANANCSPIPQITVRHGNSFRFEDINQVNAMIATNPNALMSCSGMDNKRPTARESMPMAQIDKLRMASPQETEGTSLCRLFNLMGRHEVVPPTAGGTFELGAHLCLFRF